MAYLTEEQYLDRFGDDEAVLLADTDGDGVADAERIAAAIADAEATIDSYIAARYSTPLETVPAVLTQYAADLARERLHTVQPTEEVTERAKRAVAWLKDVASGKASLPIGSGGEGGVGDPAYVERDSIYDTGFSDPLTLDYRGF
jgi:phage gp36-like protein